MDLSRLTRIDDWTWVVPRTAADTRHEARLYGSRALLEAMDDKVLEQITNVARLPGLVGAALAMPDAHWGYGFPIGGVAAFDPDARRHHQRRRRRLRHLVRHPLPAHRPHGRRHRAERRVARRCAAARHPGGRRRRGRAPARAERELDAVMLGGARWAVEQGHGIAADLAFIEEHGCIDGARPDNVSSLAKRRQRGEMGTLGSGNHYLEVQKVERVYDERAAAAFGLFKDQVVVSIHCGSRGLGHQIGTEYLVSLAKAASRLGIALPERELACAPIKSPEGQQYLGAMNAAINCALANRQILAHLARRVFARRFPLAKIDTLYDVSHNTCKAERHRVDGRERLLYVHRKGATRAFGPGHPAIPAAYREVGQPVIIGGSMGTGSYILAGTKQSEERAWSSASHGAGRAMSRNQALSRWRGRAVVDELGARGIVIRSNSMRGIAEEAPGAYKDIDDVAEATERAGLAKRVASLRPLVCIKG